MAHRADHLWRRSPQRSSLGLIMKRRAKTPRIRRRAAASEKRREVSASGPLSIVRIDRLICHFAYAC